ncbi:MAG: NAD(+)/NADH kinase [Elusimicrobiota bacterium]|jgi:NAD+ kinase|nr:NAD(+)/NADH kinase [Elusimicrobiota bacterium]
MDIKTAALFVNEAKPHSLKAYKNLRAALKTAGIKYYALEDSFMPQDIKAGTDIIFSLGGDGTLLKIARAAATRGVKIMGINGGSLGFLSAAEAAGGFTRLLSALQSGKILQIPRLMLDVSVRRGAAQVFRSPALNECVIKTDEPRATALNLSYGGVRLKEYFGDGVIIAAPTGSTAYNLAAGGPVVHPGLDVFIITAICPHTLTQRPLVLPASKTLKVKPAQRAGAPAALLSVDGQLNFRLKQGDEVSISQHAARAITLYAGDYDFFDVLTSKLKWGSR